MISNEIKYRQLLTKWYAGEISKEPTPPEHLRDYVIANIKDYAKGIQES